jgi:hypothetical protein
VLSIKDSIHYHHRMPEREPPGKNKPEFGEPAPRGRRKKQRPLEMFPEGDDLPIFSGTPQEVSIRPYVPELNIYKQPMLPGMPEVDWESILEADRRLRTRRRSGSAPVQEQSGQIWEAETAPSPSPGQDVARAEELRAVFERYRIDVATLRQLVARGDLNTALRGQEVPEELRHLLTIFADVFRPLPDERIRSPSDAVALLMTEMSHLDQEQLRVLCLDTKNRLQKMHLVYQGSLNTAMIRVGEVYKEPLRLNSAAIIVAHNHPSGLPDPSPEDILVTRQIVDAGKLLDVDCLDHLVIGQGQWVSMRERGLGFSD